MERSRPQAGWYPDPEGAGLRYWDGSQWTEHSQPPDPAGSATNPLPRSRIKRATAAAAGLLLLLFALQWTVIGIQEGWGDGSFALVAYFVAACSAVGAAVCVWAAFGQRGDRQANLASGRDAKTGH